MKEELKSWCKNMWHAHPGRIAGGLLGVFVGSFIILIGFFHTIFILVCGIVGLLIGARIDNEDDFLQSCRKITDNLYRWK